MTPAELRCITTDLGNGLAPTYSDALALLREVERLQALERARRREERKGAAA